jgi:hypothetical protein
MGKRRTVLVEVVADVVDGWAFVLKRRCVRACVSERVSF